METKVIETPADLLTLVKQQQPVQKVKIDARLLPTMSELGAKSRHLMVHFKGTGH